MAERKVVPFDEFYYQLKLTHLFEIEDRDEVEVDNWAKHKKAFYS
jgi:hypothetical protein